MPGFILYDKKIYRYLKTGIAKMEVMVQEARPEGAGIWDELWQGELGDKEIV